VIKDIETILQEFVETTARKGRRTWDERVLLHEFYLIGFLDNPFLTKDEEYKFFDMGKPKFHNLIEERLLNESFYNRGTWDDME